MPKNLNVEDFPGAVSTKGGIVMDDGRSYWTFVGVVSILEGEPAVGFAIKDKDSNWFARVEAEDGSRSINILGCQIQAVMQGGFDSQAAGVFHL